MSEFLDLVVVSFVFLIWLHLRSIDRQFEQWREAGLKRIYAEIEEEIRAGKIGKLARQLDGDEDFGYPMRPDDAP